MMYGADAEALDQRAVELESSARELQSMLREGAGSVALATLGTTITTLWRGPCAQDFANLWQSRHLVRLYGLSNMLRDAAHDVRRQAAQQRDASAASSGASAHVGPLAVCSLPEGHYPGGTHRTSFLFSDYIRRIEDVGDEKAFEILRLSTEPPKYIVNLPGIESLWFGDSLRDLPTATLARLRIHDAYAERVKAELQRAGVPSGAQVMLIGHSYGAIAAMNIASDHQFNRPNGDVATDDYHVQITHVLAAGAGLRDWMDRPPEGTNVLLAVNRWDHVATGIQAVNPISNQATPSQIVDGVVDHLNLVPETLGNVVFGGVDNESEIVGDGRVVYEFTTGRDVTGHHYDNYVDGLNAAGGAADDWMTDAARAFFLRNPEMVSTRVLVMDEMETAP